MDRVVRAVAVGGDGWAVCAGVLTIDPSGHVVAREGGAAATASMRRLSLPGPASARGGRAPQGLVIGRFASMRTLGPELGALVQSASLSVLASEVGWPDWRVSPVGGFAAGGAEDIAIFSQRICMSLPGRVVLGFVAPAPGRSMCREDAEIIHAALPFLQARAELALGPATSYGRWLTRREQEVLDRLAQGLSVKEIGEALGRSPHTVHDHVKSLHRKLGASNRGELIARAFGARI